MIGLLLGCVRNTSVHNHTRTRIIPYDTQKREVDGFFVSKNEEKKDGKVRAQVKFIYPDETGMYTVLSIESINQHTHTHTHTGEIVREVDFDQIRLLRT